MVAHFDERLTDFDESYQMNERRKADDKLLLH